ncbi:MAG: RNA-binding cell elongation regulator Jag/EloR [Oscillospiraceae bacterium]
MREIIMTGKTVEEATELACKELGLDREEVSVEILEMPAKKLFKTIPAKVKVTSDADVKAQEDAQQEAAVKATADAMEEKKAERIAKESSLSQKPNKANDRKPDMHYEAVPIDLAVNEKARLGVEYLTEIVSKMGLENVKITAQQHGEATILKVDGTNVSALIGRRGETMEALSYLCGLVANHIGGDYAKIGIDVAGYRSKRENDLSELAKRIAAKVIKTGRSQALEPMNPYERRIIHSAIGEVEGVKSESTGEGAQRRVVIICTGANAVNERPERYDKPLRANTNVRGADNRVHSGGERRPRTQGNHPHGGRSPQPRTNENGEYAPRSSVPQRDFATRPRTDAAPIVPKRTETISDGGDMPLYGKIEI